MRKRTALARSLNVGSVFVVAIWLFPIYWILLASFQTERKINEGKPTLHFAPTGENYAEIWSKYGFGGAMKNSLIIVAISTAIVMCLAFVCAYALARMRLKRGDALALVILSFRFMPGVVFIIPYFLMFQKYHLTDSYTGMTIVYVGFGLPFAVWLLRGFLLDLPRDIEDAARLDGLGWLATMRRIVLPLARPGIAVATMFTFIFSWNEYLYALVLTQVRTQTAPVALGKLIGAYTILWGHLSAAIVVQLVPMVIVVFLLQRHIIRGLALGAVR